MNNAIPVLEPRAPCAPLPPNKEYFSLEEAAPIMGVTRRHAHRLLARTPRDLIRLEDTGGRPRITYHFSAHPKLHAHWNAGFHGPELKIVDRAPLSPDDLAIATLRAQAVEEYWARCELMTERKAAVQTQLEWASRPRSKTVRAEQRLARWRRKSEQSVTVGHFCLSTLRTWARIYRNSRFEIASLAPERKAATGRSRKAIPEPLLDLIQALASSTARADIVLAVERARKAWAGEWPDVSYDTIRRRIRERDPAKVADALGKRGVSEFNRLHSPDIEKDYSAFSYNEEWQLDDVTEDFYCHGSDPTQILRPFAYAIIRVSTREWICGVSTETPITQDQVRALVGFALANPRGGIPDRIRFERGTIACDDYLQDLLQSLGIKVSRTTMDGGRVHPGTAEDRATGHFQGKAIVEANIRLHHRHNWDAAGQVGPDERSTAPARLETLKAYAAACAKQGLPSTLPNHVTAQAMVFQALEKHNAKPHGGLPEIVTPEGEVRHMTPNEAGAARQAESIRVMDENLLPLFFKKGYQVPVTKNGIRFQTGTYGRFDEDLQALAGTKVMVYGVPELPGSVYIHELGRCVDLDRKVRQGEADEAFTRKTRISRAKRNQYEQLVERATAAEGTITTESIRFTLNPVPGRALAIVTNQPLADRAAAMKQAGDRHVARKETLNSRFSLDPESSIQNPASSKPRRGLLSRTADLEEQLAVFHGPNPKEEDDRFNV